MSRFFYFCTDHHIEFISSTNRFNQLIFRTFDFSETADQARLLGLERLISAIPRFLVLGSFTNITPGISNEMPIMVKTEERWLKQQTL